MNQVIDFIVRAVEALGGNPLAPFLFVLAYSLACLAAPITIFVIAGGVLFGFWGGLALNMLAILLGSHAAFYIARRVGKLPVEKFVHRLNPKLARTLFSDFGFRTFLLVRLVGFPPFILANYLAGLSGLSAKKYTAASVVGLFPWTLVLTYFSDTLWEVLVTAGADGLRSALLEKAQPLLWGALALVALTALTVYLKRFLPKKRHAGISSV